MKLRQQLSFGFFATAAFGLSTLVADNTAFGQVDLTGPRPVPVAPPRLQVETEDDQVESDNEVREDFYVVENNLTLGELTIRSREILSFVPSTLTQYQNHVDQAPNAIRTLESKIIELVSDPESELQQAAMIGLLKADGIELHRLSADEQRAAVDRLLATMEALSPNDQLAGIALTHCRTILHSGNSDLAKESYRRLGAVFAAQSPEFNQRVVTSGQRMQGAAKRLDMVGEPFELFGQTVKEESFDIQALQGKYVLVYFWTTLSGPAESELERLKLLYDQLGSESVLEIVLISLDEKGEVVDRFLTKKDYGWPCLHEEGAGWNNSWAIRYGVEQLPTAILVDPVGNAVSFDARWSNLFELRPELANAAQESETVE